jgi:hypothetical protein
MLQDLLPWHEAAVGHFDLLQAGAALSSHTLLRDAKNRFHDCCSYQQHNAICITLSLETWCHITSSWYTACTPQAVAQQQQTDTTL